MRSQLRRNPEGVRSKSRQTNDLTSIVAIGAAAAFLGAVAARQFYRRRRFGREQDSAPEYAGLHSQHNGACFGRTVTINKPRSEVYAYWRDFANLPAFMENIESIDVKNDGRSEWKIAAPADGSVTLTTEIAEERQDELITWRSIDHSDIKADGHVAFRDAPNGRGTEVEAVIAYKPPLGNLGRIIAKVLQKEPEVQTRRDLKRFKMLMETGEVADSRFHADEHKGSNDARSHLAKSS